MKSETRKEGIELLKLDVVKLIEMLNMALAEEWLAYYQYWVGARVMEGPMRSEIEAELLDHADEELEHAQKVIDRIIQLDGMPLVSPDQWMKAAKCKYEAPVDPYVEVILEQNLRSERCAIQRYQEIIDYTRATDYSTALIATEILQDELDHETDIINFQKDIKAFKAHIMK